MIKFSLVNSSMSKYVNIGLNNYFINIIITKLIKIIIQYIYEQRFSSMYDERQLIKLK